MNELERAVSILLAQTAPAPEFERLERRARHRRIRHWSTIVVAAVVMVAGTVGVAGAIGHGSSSPQVAVSPTTTTTLDADGPACALSRLQQQQAEIERIEKQLNDQLTRERTAHSPNAGATDAEHQAVLRELADVEHQILAAQAASGRRPDLSSSANSLSPDDRRCTTTTTPTTVPAESAATWCSEYRVLDALRVQLRALVEQLNRQETAELNAHSPIAGQTDAAHQAVLRELSDVQQRMLQLERRLRRGDITCPTADEATTTTTVSTP